MMEPPTEDDPQDILHKAQRGLGLDDAALALRCQTDAPALQHFRKHPHPDHPLLLPLTTALGLHPQAFRAACARSRPPCAPPLPACLTRITTPFGPTSVNAYLLHPAGQTEALLVDTGTAPDAVLQALRDQGLSLRAILLTHTHADHTHGLAALRSRYPQATLYAPALEPLAEACPLPATAFTLATLQIVPIETPGHTRGHTAFYLPDTGPPLLFSGDALFAGSVGKAPPADWPSHLRAIRRQLLSLPPHTLVLPGHGPASTLAEERAHNPFFPPE